MSLPRYPEYKDSGVAWLGEVPGHWEVAALKRGFHVVGGSTPKSDNEAYWDGEIIWVTPSDLSKLSGFEISDSQRKITTEGLASCGTTLVPFGSIILSTRAPIGSLAIADSELCTNQGCKALVPSDDIHSRFYAYFLSIATGELNIRGKGTTFLELSGDELGSFKITFPTASEQTAIAAFLDRETGKIDALVAEQEKLIALLKEKRQAVISHAVTKGLNPAARMKDSGIEWLGEVPEHWAVGALGYLASIQTGSTPDRSKPAYWEGEIPWLKTGEINYELVLDSDEKITEAGLQNSAAKIAEVGTLMMAMYGQGVTRGRVAILGIRAAYNQACAAITLGSKLFNEYAKCFFVMAYWFIRDTGNETSQMNLGSGVIAKIKILIPPMEEQRTIVAFLDRETAKLDALSTEAQRGIELLKERRSALISAAVTGKIDVRSFSPALEAA